MRKLIILLLSATCAVAQVNTALTPAPKFQFISSNGLPLSGGCLFSFVTGTSTPLATYTDATGLTANANPVILDANGSANVWLGPQKYRLQLFTAGGIGCSSGSQIWQVDGVSGSNIQGSAPLNFTAQTAPICNATQYILWADSSAQRWKFCNNGVIDTIVGAATTDTLTNKALAFSEISSGTNTGTSLTIGNGSSLNASGTGSLVATAAPWTGITGSLGPNINNTFQLGNGSSLQFVGTATLAGTMTNVNAGTFTNTQINEYMQSQLNSCNPSSEYQATQAGNETTDAMSGCIAVPSTATVHQQNAVAGYVNTKQTGGSGGAVAGYFSARVLSGSNNGPSIWALNPIIQDVAGPTGEQMIGIEDDVNVVGSPARVWGMLITGNATGTIPSGVGNASALDVRCPGFVGGCAAGTQWQGGLNLETACCQTAAINVGPLASGNTQSSQSILLNATSSGGANQQINIAENSSGYVVWQCAAANLSVSSGFNAGTLNTGTTGSCAFTVTVGTGTAGSTGVLTLPSDSAGWVCMATNQTRADLIQQTANTATSVTLTNFGTTFAATNWTNSDVIAVLCGPR